MAWMRRQKFTIALLAAYWPTLFVLSHVPIPELVRQAGVSDKNLHLLAYMLLTILLWSSIRPHERVTLRSRALGWVLAILVAYSLADEWLQGLVGGRSKDPYDLVADFLGIMGGLGLLTAYSFWPALLITVGVSIFALTNFTRANLADLVPLTNAALNFLFYALFTAVWLQCISVLSLAGPPKGRWWLWALAFPSGLLVAVKLGSVAVDKPVEPWDVFVPAAAIVAVVLVRSLIGSLRGGLGASSGAPSGT